MDTTVNSKSNRLDEIRFVISFRMGQDEALWWLIYTDVP